MADNETAKAGGAGNVLHPIACSHCRQRKRKCDRQLPHCLQCSHDPSNCHYPEQNKRGIPIGFINRLEARLAETEDALYRVLQLLDNEEPKSMPHPQAQTKSERIKEWDELPLQSMGDIRKWYHQRVGPDPSSLGSASGEPPASNAPWPSAPLNRITVPITDLPNQDPDPDIQLQTEMAGMSSSLGTDGDSMMEAPWEAQAEPSEGRANDLGKKKPHLYF
ncbi:hypothetical protein B0T10DRAFT_471126 [Thelonectria olida]|uniref:Zn(2)-C6 fungal-type domain-containing protein n=1 Tax=Thelonectria olida TaxID=1576542 RepID=A0A9P9AWM3_9HYPO|nr:hypothetical protein B0T10DRAFT_471126 [Thelonectria olida]